VSYSFIGVTNGDRGWLESNSQGEQTDVTYCNFLHALEFYTGAPIVINAPATT